MPAHASRTLAPAPSAPPSGAERGLLAQLRPRRRLANAGTPAELSASPASRPVKLRSVDSGLPEFRFRESGAAVTSLKAEQPFIHPADREWGTPAGTPS